MRRVVITGAGSVNALGGDVPSTWGALARGQSGVTPLNFRDSDRLTVQIGAQIHDWDHTRFSRSELSLYDRVTQFAVVAAAEAIAMAGGLPQTTGVILGTAAGGIATWEESYRAVFADHKTRVPPLTVPRLMASAPAAHIAMRHGLSGPNFTVSSACASANHAIGQAFHMVRSGVVPAMLAGGTEAMLLFGGVKAWEGLRVLSGDGCRPFSADRAGMVLGEGAGVFVLEDAEHAKARGAQPLAEICGFGMTADAGEGGADIVQPSVPGAARAISAALTDAKLAPADIGYINAHGTGTRLNDRSEVAAIRAAFGAHARHLLVSSTKAMHGHCIGATGAIELLAVILALREGIVAPTLGLNAPDPECDLDHVPLVARQANITAALSNAFAFGGLNAVLALKQA